MAPHYGLSIFVQVFTLNAVPLAPEEAVAGGICRNFISRDLLEASNHRDALKVILGVPNLTKVVRIFNCTFELSISFCAASMLVEQICGA